MKFQLTVIRNIICYRKGRVYQHVIISTLLVRFRSLKTVISDDGEVENSLEVFNHVKRIAH